MRRLCVANDVYVGAIPSQRHVVSTHLDDDRSPSDLLWNIPLDQGRRPCTRYGLEIALVGGGEEVTGERTRPSRYTSFLTAVIVVSAQVILVSRPEQHWTLRVTGECTVRIHYLLELNCHH